MYFKKFLVVIRSKVVISTCYPHSPTNQMLEFEFERWLTVPIYKWKHCDYSWFSWNILKREIWNCVLTMLCSVLYWIVTIKLILAICPCDKLWTDNFFLQRIIFNGKMNFDDPLPFETEGKVTKSRNKRRSSILKSSNARPVLQVLI